MKGLPRVAQPVVAEIRKHVKRPDYRRFKIEGEDDDSSLRMSPRKGDPRQRKGLFISEKYCPLGLLPYATEATPTVAFGGIPEGKFSNEAMREFYTWWDDVVFKDRKAAVDRVWGKKK